LQEFVTLLSVFFTILVIPSISSAQTPGYTITADSVIELAFARNPGIRAARYQLESAQHNFDLFESELSQFTPLVLDSKIKRETDAEKGAEITAGMEREFFNGASAGLNVGNSSVFERGARTHAQFVESEIEFPLFSSNTRLERLSERTFEENDLQEARLDYIDEVRDQIEDAQATFYEWTEATSMLRANTRHRDDLILLAEAIRGNDRVEVLDRIQSLESDIRVWELRIATREIQLAQLLVIQPDSIAAISEVQIDVSSPKHLGRHYVAEPFSRILKRALTHDTESEILRSVIENAEEKIRLAERGKWDITVALDGRYNYGETGAGRDDTYSAGMGLRLKKFDRKVLRHSRSKALADVRSAEAQIEQRAARLQSRIGEHKVELDNLVDRISQLTSLSESRHQIYTFKRQDFLNQAITLDELLNASRNLLTTEEDYHATIAEYLNTIRSLDSVCGVYFAKLGIDIHSQQ
jgi:hypothetical protein